MNVAPYSCWPVFVTPLNLPPGTLLRSEYIFLALVIPGPEHPGRKLNILMQPLVDEFQELWKGVTTWDASLKEEFTMRGIYLWSVHDFMAYGDFSGWSTMVGCHAHMGVVVEDSYSLMGVRLAGLIPIGVSCLKIIHLEMKLMLFARTPRCLMRHLGT